MRSALFTFSCIGIGCTSLIVIAIRRYMAGRLCRNAISLAGKTVVITGGNSGIGKATAFELAKREARVVLGCRDINSAESTTREIKRIVPAANVICKHLDLASLISVNNFAEEIKVQEDNVHILINNAGVGFCPCTSTEDGFEMQMGVNHLGHFYLTNLLLDKLKASTPSRILVVTSTLAKRGNINLNNLNISPSEYNKNAAYHNSKLANNLFCRELACRLKGTDVGVFAISPGVVFTNLMRHSPTWLTTLAYPLLWLLMRSPTDGCQTIVHCATDEQLSNPKYSGKFFRDCVEQEWDSKSLDDLVAKELWKISEKLVGLH